MTNGILFIWSEKELINDIIKILEVKNFVYIENFAVILLNSQNGGKNGINKENSKPKISVNSKITSFFKVQPKKISPESENNQNSNQKNEAAESSKKTLLIEEFSNLNQYDPRDLFENKKSDFFFKSKKVLLMFRRVFKLFFIDLTLILIKKRSSRKILRA